MLDYANEQLGGIKTQITTLENQRVTLKAPVLDAGRKIDAMFNPHIELLREVEKTYKSKIGDYIAEKNRLAAIEQARLNEEAERERQRIAEEAAEQERLAREEQRQREEQAAEQRRKDAAAAEELRQKAEAAAQGGNDDDALLLQEQAEREEREARDREDRERRAAEEDAEAKRQQAMALRASANVVTVAPVRAASKPSNLSTSQTWKAEVTDITQVIKAVAEGRAPSTLLQINQTVLNQMARAMKLELRVPGIHVWAENNVIHRKRAAG